MSLYFFFCHVILIGQKNWVEKPKPEIHGIAVIAIIIFITIVNLLRAYDAPGIKFHTVL